MTENSMYDEVFEPKPPDWESDRVVFYWGRVMIDPLLCAICRSDFGMEKEGAQSAGIDAMFKKPNSLFEMAFKIAGFDTKRGLYSLDDGTVAIRRVETASSKMAYLKRKWESTRSGYYYAMLGEIYNIGQLNGWDVEVMDEFIIYDISESPARGWRYAQLLVEYQWQRQEGVFLPIVETRMTHQFSHSVDTSTFGFEDGIYAAERYPDRSTDPFELKKLFVGPPPWKLHYSPQKGTGSDPHWWDWQKYAGRSK